MKNSEKPKDLPSLIRAERKAHGLRQEELANMAEVGINLISDAERGRTSIRLDKLLQILNSLGIEIVARRGEHEVPIIKKINTYES